MTDYMRDTTIATLNAILRRHAGLHADAAAGDLTDPFAEEIDLVLDLRADLAVSP